MTVPYETKTLRVLTAAGADDNGITVGCGGCATATVQLSGTLSASTVYFEGTVDNSTWYAILGFNRVTGVKASSATAVGLYVFNVTGLLNFRVRLDWTSADAVTADVRLSSIPIATLVTAS